MTVILYYFVIFILGLFLLGRVISRSKIFKGSDPSIVRSYYISCTAFSLLCVCTVMVGVSTGEVLDTVFLYMGEFFRMAVLINCCELCAVITNKKNVEKRSVYVVTSELFYLGVTTLVVRALIGGSKIKYGIFGTQFVMGDNFGTVLYIIFNVIILFFYGAYTYSFYYTCTKKREIYIFRRCLYIVVVLAICLFIEAFCYLEFKEYIPTMMFGMIFALTGYKNLFVYKRKIEYNENDYIDILAPTYEIPAFVCDDKGIVIFENTRAFVMRQMYRDSYKGNYLSDLFEMSLYDMERLRDSSITAPFEIYCNYRMDTREVKLTVQHTLDRYSEIFSTKIEVEFIEESDFNNEDLEVRNKNRRLVLTGMSYEDRNILRINALIKMFETQKEFYDTQQRLLFIANLKGIRRMGRVLGMTALVKLCNTIKIEIVHDQPWENIEAYMIDLDRQYETLKYLVQ